MVDLTKDRKKPFELQYRNPQLRGLKRPTAGGIWSQPSDMKAFDDQIAKLQEHISNEIANIQSELVNRMVETKVSQLFDGAKCDACQAANREIAKFCDQCGISLKKENAESKENSSSGS